LESPSRGKKNSSYWGGPVNFLKELRPICSGGKRGKGPSGAKGTTAANLQSRKKRACSWKKYGKGVAVVDKEKKRGVYDRSEENALHGFTGKKKRKPPARRSHKKLTESSISPGLFF